MKDEYYKTKESIKEYIRLAEGVNGGALIDQLKAFVKKGIKVLELGSGPGEDWAILSADFDVTGSDFSQLFVDHLTKKYPDGEFMKLDAKSIHLSERFDCIYANKVLHHLSDSDLEASLQQQANILNKDGVVCHSFWKGSGSEIFKGMFVNYHEIADLSRMYAERYEVVKMETYQEFEANDSILVIAKKKG